MDINNDVISLLSRSVSFLRNWPKEKLRENSDACTVYYFDRNQILVRDSNNSDWIYVVLKGSLSVMKKLKRVEPQHDVIVPRKRTRISYPLPKKRRTRSIGGGNNSVSWNYQSRTNSKDNITPTSLSIDENNNTISAERRRFGSTMETYKTVYEVESKLEKTLPGYHNTADRLGSLDYDQIINDHRSRLVPRSDIGRNRRAAVHTPASIIAATTENSFDQTVKGECGSNHLSSRVGDSLQGHSTSSSRNNSHTQRKSSFLPAITNNNKVTNPSGMVNDVRSRISHDDDDENVEDDDHGSPTNDADDERGSPIINGEERKQRRRKRRRISKTTKGVYLAPSRQHENEVQVQSECNLEQESVVTPEKGSVSSSEARHSVDIERPQSLNKGNAEESITDKLTKLQIQYQRRVIDREGRKTISEELDHKGRRDFRFTEADLDPTIIEMQVLERGQYFGLAALLFPDQPSLSVVSNGAECLVMSKKLFLQFASEKCMRHLRQNEYPYPSDQELSRKLQEVINWQASRAMVYRKLDEDIQRKQALKRQFPSYQGQYCFRTGPT